MRLAWMIALLLTGCTSADLHRSDRADLAAQLAGRTAGPPQDCVSIEPTANLRPVDPQTVTVERGDTLYVNHLGGACGNLEPTDALIVEVHGSQYCRGDHFRSQPFGGGAVPGAVCLLGQFVPYRRPR
jgi:hypothetical protein